MCIDFRLLFFSALLLPAVALARFSGDLSADERIQCGLQKLDDTQLACVDALVQRELLLAKQGRTKGFAKTFSQRRTDMEIKATGLSLLTEEEKTGIDTRVAAKLALTPIPAAPLAMGSDAVTIDVKKKGLEVHGSVSLMVGGNSNGGSFYGGAMETTLSDRARGLDLTVGYSEIHSKGMGRWGRYGYGYGNGYGAYGYGFGSFGYHSWDDDLLGSSPYRYSGTTSLLPDSTRLNEPGAFVRKQP